MSGPKRNPDRLNTIGVVVVGICTAVLVYVTIVALEAFYVNDSSEIQSQQDYGGQDRDAIGHKADEIQHISDSGPNANGTFHIPISVALKQVADVVKSPGADLTHLASASFPSTKVTRSTDGSDLKPAPTNGAAPTDGSGTGSGSAAGSGSATTPAMFPTGTGTGTPSVPGAGGPPTTPAGAGSAAAKGHAP